MYVINSLGSEDGQEDAQSSYIRVTLHCVCIF